MGYVETTELRAKIGHCGTRECSGLRKGEWICAECAAKNYSARISCYRCSLRKWESEIRSKGKAAFDWECFRCKFSNFSFRHCCLRCKIPKHISDDMRIQQHGVPWICRFCELENWGKNRKCFKCRQQKAFAIWQRARWRLPQYHEHRHEWVNARHMRPAKMKCHSHTMQNHNVASDIKKIKEVVHKVDLDSSSSSSEEDPIELEHSIIQPELTDNEDVSACKRDHFKSENYQEDLIDFSDGGSEPMNLSEDPKIGLLGEVRHISVTETLPTEVDRLSTGTMEICPSTSSMNKALTGIEVKQDVPFVPLKVGNIRDLIDTMVGSEVSKGVSKPGETARSFTSRQEMAESFKVGLEPREMLRK